MEISLFAASELEFLVLGFRGVRYFISFGGARSLFESCFPGMGTDSSIGVVSVDVLS